MLFEFTPLNEFGPFYSTEQTCLDATIYDTAFWFTKSTTFVEGDIDDSFEGRCAAKIEIHMYEYLDNGENLTAVSSWGDNMFSIRTGDINYVRKEHFWHVYDSCIEYKCSRSNGN